MPFPDWLVSNAAEVDPQYGTTLRRLYRGGVIEIGTFRCPAEHPLFRNSGPIRDFNVVFPRTRGYLRHEGGKPFLASPLVATLYNHRQRYERCGFNVGGDRSDWIAITDAREAAAVASEVDPAAAERLEHPLAREWAPCSPRLYLRQRLLVRSLVAGRPADPVRVEEEALAIFRAAVVAGADRRDGPRPSAAERALYEVARVILERRFHEPLRLDAIAAELGVSISYLCRTFRKHGASVHQTLLHLRLREALERVLDSRRELTEIALDLGFSSHSHFTAAFTRAYRTTPSAARRIRLWPPPHDARWPG